MDLITVNSKLENNQYSSAEEFEEDIHLIFRNCFAYNNIGSEIYYMGKALETAFNERWINKPILQDKQKEKLRRVRNDDGTDNGKLYFPFKLHYFCFYSINIFK
jgi:hypothetical protein